MRLPGSNPQLRPLLGLLLSIAFVLLIAAGLPSAKADVSCTTESQMSSAQRNALATAARAMAGDVQHGDTQTLRRRTIPPVAQNFSSIASSVQSLQPLIAKATVTVDNLYLLDATHQASGATQSDFSCGIPGSLMTVDINFHNLPPGSYAMAILHATGVPEPQMITLILQQSAPQHWMLAGFFTHPMTMAGHDGLWFWTQARAYAQRKMDWNAWLYYRTAEDLLRPVDFLSSPNLEKLRHEAADIRPEGLPGPRAMLLRSGGQTFSITALRATDSLGPLDLAVHYRPDASESAALNNSVSARQQVMQAAQALLTAHPELQTAFHGFWMNADQGDSSVFALELPMTQVAAAAAPATSPPNPAVH